MRVGQVDIRKFRGVDSTSLASCGGLNVLIGKNNSGKSTILDAIDGFFEVVSSGSLVIQDQGNFGRDMDFHRGDESPKPIIISVTFDLTSEELENVRNDVISEAPQMKHALESIDESYRLRVAVTSVKRSRNISYVSRIELTHSSGPGAKHQNRVFLSMKNDAALEVLERAELRRRAERQAADIIEFGRRIDPDDFQMLRRESTDRAASVRFTRRLASINADVMYDIDSLIKHADSYGDFRRQLDALARTEESSARRQEETPLTQSIDTFTGESHEMPNYVSKILERVGAMTLLHLRDRRDPVGREEAQRLLSLKTRRKGPEVLRNIQDTVQSLLGVSIDAFESEKSSLAQSDGRAEMDVDEVLVEMNGAGIREALRLILDNELGSPQILLVEEPEIHLHPALELSMLRYLKAASGRTQVFVTTHSTNFLDTSEMRNVYLTRREPWVTATLLDYEQAETAIPDELGLRLSSLFMYDRLVFVEGSSDETILRELASTADVNFGQSNVGFVVMGSARNFTHYANQATIDFLTKRRVKMSFILDRDEASEDEVTALIDRLGKTAETHVLERREIENYLTVPRALSEFIREKKCMQNLKLDDVSEEAVDAQLKECAEKLRALAIQKRIARTLCAPIFFDRSVVFSEGSEQAFDGRLAAEIDRQINILGVRKAEIEPLTRKQDEQISDVWDRKKMDIVPGDELLDCVCRHFGVRFKKKRDGGRLARLLTAEELPSELTNLLKGLVA